LRLSRHRRLRDGGKRCGTAQHGPARQGGHGRKRSDVKLAVSPYTNPIKTDDLKRYRDAAKAPGQRHLVRFAAFLAE